MRLKGFSDASLEAKAAANKLAGVRPDKLSSGHI